MKIKSRISAFLIVASLFMVFTVPVQGQNQAARADEMKNNPQNMPKGPFAMITGLTDEQKTKIKDLMYEGNKDKQMMKAQLDEKKAHLRTLTLTDSPDRKAIDKTIDEMSALRGTMMKHAIDMKFNLKSVLSPDQYKEWEMHRQQSKFMNQRGNWSGNGMQPGNKMKEKNNRSFNHMGPHPSAAPDPDPNN